MTKAQKIKYFKDNVYKYQKELGLLNWEIHIDLDNREDVRGSAYSNIEGKIATLYYSPKWISNKETTRKEIRRVAYHELLEVYFSSLRQSLAKFYSEQFTDEKVHAVLRLVENMKF